MKTLLTLMMTGAVNSPVAIRYCTNIISLIKARKSLLLLKKVLYPIPLFSSTAVLQVSSMKYRIMLSDMHFVTNAAVLLSICKELFSFVRITFVK